MLRPAEAPPEQQKPADGSYTPAITIWPHQQRTVDFAIDKPGAMLALEMGLGKSACALEIARLAGARRILILAPLSVVDMVWPKEIEKFAPGYYHVTALGQKVKGTVAKKLQRLEADAKWADYHKKPHVVIINYESAWRSPMGPWLKGRVWDLVVMDESHRLKAPASKQSLLCSQLYSRARRRLALTGTPMPQGPLDIYAQFRAVDRTAFGTSYQEFKNTFSEPHPTQLYQLVYKNMEMFQKKLLDIAIQIKAKDELDLPEFTDSERPVQLCPNARRVYIDLIREFEAELNDEQTITANNILTRMMRLQQIASGFTIDNDGKIVRNLDRSKAEALQEILEDLPPDESCLVFARFTENLRVIGEVAEKSGRGYHEISGARKELDAWESNKKGAVLGVQLQAGGLGLDLTKARTCIYYSLDYNSANYLQSRARVLRPGQNRAVQYINIIAEGTMDRRVIEALQNKEDLVKQIMDNKGSFGGLAVPLSS